MSSTPDAQAETPLLSHSRTTAPGSDPERWLLVLHGIFGKGRNWGSIARQVVEARPEWGALLIDLRLHGESRHFRPPHTVETSAEDLHRLVDHLDLPAAGVLGHSFGGKVALAYAREGRPSSSSAGPAPMRWSSSTRRTIRGCVRLRPAHAGNHWQ